MPHAASQLPKVLDPCKQEKSEPRLEIVRWGTCLPHGQVGVEVFESSFSPLHPREKQQTTSL